MKISQHKEGNFMVVASTESKEKYFHTRKCRHAKIIKPKNETTFKTIGVAKTHGYKPCPLCITSEKISSQIPFYLIRELEHEHLSIVRTARAVYVITSKPHYKTKYKLILSTDGNSIVCYHLNNILPGEPEEYHLQTVFTDAVSALSYIRMCFGYEANVLKQKPKKHRHSRSRQYA